MTSSSRKNYNYLALRGNGIDDMEYVDSFKLDPKVAYTPRINEVMIEHVYQENIKAGIDEKKAMANKMKAQREIKEMLAKKGML